MSGIGGIIVGVAGGVVLLLGVTDLFLTVFNHDGFTFLAGRVHAASWAGLRASRRLLPGRARAGYLSVGSAAMLPLTLLWWLVLEAAGFAMMYLPGVAAKGFSIEHGIPTVQSAFYLSGGDLTSLTFGDVVAVSAPYRALVDLETVIGLATFTIGLTYVLAAFDAIGTLNQMHSRVRRHAISPNQPASILARHFRHRNADELTTLLQSLVEDLSAYDDALRRYPVVFYFHTRRPERSIPRIFTALGKLIELLRWGIPPDQDTATNPYLLALQDQYMTTGRRLLRSFVGPAELPSRPPLGEADFNAAYLHGADGTVRAFADLRTEASDATGIAASEEDTHYLYRQYCEWWPFHAMRQDVEKRVRHALCYEDDADR